MIRATLGGKITELSHNMIEIRTYVYVMVNEFILHKLPSALRLLLRYY